jgi:hypothetical protein
VWPLAARSRATECVEVLMNVIQEDPGGAADVVA